MIKIIKIISPPKKKITSYAVKFALDRYFCSEQHQKSTMKSLFEESRKCLLVCIRDVLKDANVRELCSSPMHRDLEAIGVKKIVLEEKGILFVGNGDASKCSTYCLSCHQKTINCVKNLKTIMLFATLPYHGCCLSC